MKKVLCKIMGLVALVSFLFMLYSVAGVEQMEEGFSLWEPLVNRVQPLRGRSIPKEIKVYCKKA